MLKYCVLRRRRSFLTPLKGRRGREKNFFCIFAPANLYTYYCYGIQSQYYRRSYRGLPAGEGHVPDREHALPPRQERHGVEGAPRVLPRAVRGEAAERDDERGAAERGDEIRDAAGADVDVRRAHTCAVQHVDRVLGVGDRAEQDDLGRRGNVLHEPVELFVIEFVEEFRQVLHLAAQHAVRDAVDVRYAEEARTGTTTYTGAKSGRAGIVDCINNPNATEDVTLQVSRR